MYIWVLCITLYFEKILRCFHTYIYIYYIFYIYNKSHIMFYMLLKFYFYIILFSPSLKQHVNVCFNVTWIKLNFLILKYFVEI